MAHYKMGVYGEPAVGKSVFALGWPKPFFICTDENYEYLKPFGAKDKDHIQVTSWQEFKDFIKTADFNKYDTIVIDLIEDLYQWADAEYCRKNRIDDLSDVGYGKGYKVVRNDFTYYILKVLNQKTNVIILSHQEAAQDKTSRGVTFTSYQPSSYIPKKCWELINGKLRFFFRAHVEETNVGDTLERERLLSVRPKAHEFQINRGLDVDSLPDDIPLTYAEFTRLFGEPSSIGEINIKPTESVIPDSTSSTNTESKPSASAVEEVKEVKTKRSYTKKSESTPAVNTVKSDLKPGSEPEQKVEATQTAPVTLVEEAKSVDTTSASATTGKETKVEPAPVTAEEAPKSKVKETVEAPEVKSSNSAESTLDRINAIRAKLGLPPKN